MMIEKLFLFLILLYFFDYSVAGTAGAVVTCPLEVVKTRLQSSTAFMPVHASRIAELPGMQNPTSDALRRPEQRRKLSTTILRRVRPQVNIMLLLITNAMFVCRIQIILSIRFRSYQRSHSALIKSV